jgi:putative acetyltransferase
MPHPVSSKKPLLLTARSPEQMEDARSLFRIYARELGIDLGFQNFEQELLHLPGEYAAPQGALLLASVQGQAAGCCAMRPIVATDYPNACEMKRLFVLPAHRRSGLGRQLAEAVLEAARVAGYRHILLDTLDEMESARALYQDLGFEEIPPYYHNPLAGAHYLKADLQVR